MRIIVRSRTRVKRELSDLSTVGALDSELSNGCDLSMLQFSPVSAAPGPGEWILEPGLVHG